LNRSARLLRRERDDCEEPAKLLDDSGGVQGWDGITLGAVGEVAVDFGEAVRAAKAGALANGGEARDRWGVVDVIGYRRGDGDVSVEEL
jgi:hypothetical protein